MARKKNTIKSNVRKHMKNLGVYKKEYRTAIEVFADMVFQYEQLTEEWEKMGLPVTEEYVNNAGATNERKVPILTAIEKLRTDILKYTDKLCLNPKALERVTTENAKQSTLAKVLSEIS